MLSEAGARFGVDFAGRRIDDVLADETIDQIFARHQDVDEPVFNQLVGCARGDFAAGFRHDLLGLGVDKVEVRLHAAPAFGAIARRPAVARPAIDRLVVEGAEDLLAVHAQRIEQRRRRQLALAVDADEQNVLGVELEIEPRAAIGDDAGGEQQLAARMGLALVVVEEHAGRTVHLRDDDALGAVDDERALVRHQRNVAEIDVLLLDVLDRFRAGFLIRFEHDEAQLHLQRRGVGHVALLAFLDVEFRLLELVGDVFQHRALREVADREHRTEHRFDALLAPVGGADVLLQKLIVGAFLDLDEVRHRACLGDLPK